MPPHVLYQIPLATWPVRLIMGAACLFVLVTICVWWLPRSIRRVRNLFGKSRAQAAVGMAVAMISISIAIGFGLLFLLIALIRNPQAYVTDTGVTKENLFHQKPVSFTWEEISHVHCRSENVGAISSIIVVAKDGRGQRIARIRFPQIMIPEHGHGGRTDGAGTVEAVLTRVEPGKASGYLTMSWQVHTASARASISQASDHI